MKKKQLLATLVMLSLMQGNAYAADKITEDDFDKTNTYTPASNEVGPIYIIGNKEKDYTINAKDGLNITDVEHRGIVVAVDIKDGPADMSSLTINGGVKIGDNDKETITITEEKIGYDSETALIQVGQGRRGKGGKLAINGDLSIQNVNFENADNLITVAYSGDSGNDEKASSFEAKNIYIDNVIGSGIGAILNTSASNRVEDVTFKANSINVSNSTVGYGIVGSYAKIETGNIIFENVNVKNYAIGDNDLKSGDIIFRGTDADNPATFGGKNLISFVPFENDEIIIDGVVKIENVKGTFKGLEPAAAFLYGGSADSGKLRLPSLYVNNLEMEYAGIKDMYAVQISADGSFEIDNITAKNITFSGNGNFSRGAAVTIVSTETNKKINSICVENVTTNAATSIQDFSGIILENTKMPEGIDCISAKNVSADNVITYALFVYGQDLKSRDVNIENISSKNKNAYGVRLTKAYDTTEGFDFEKMYIGDVRSENGIAMGLYATNGSDVDIKTLQVEKVKADNKFAAAVNMSGSNLSVDNAYINLPDNEDNYGDYEGYYDGAASDGKAKVNNIALRSVKGADVNWNNADGTYLVYGTVIAGSGIKNDTNGGSITINGKTTQIYGDVFAGNGGKIDITLGGAGSVLEGQIDDYHEVGNSKLGDTFHNSAFVDDAGNELEVSSAGEAKLNINDGAKWIARGQSFVDTVTLNDGTIDMSKNENSSVTVNDLSGNGKVVMRLNTGDRDQSDMLYVTGSLKGNYELQIVGNEFDINEITEDNPLRFATVKGDVNTENLKARSVDTGFFNNEYTITKENFADGDEENLIYNNSGVEGDDDHTADYKPGNGYIESTFDGNDTNLLIEGLSNQTVSDAGKTIINMSRANYSNAIYMDRLNKRMGEARYLNSEDEQGMWVRLRHDRIGKDEQFRSQNTMYEVGYDVKQPVDSGDHRIGMAIDYMDGKTSYSGIAGDGDIKRYGLLLYDTWLGEKGHYTDFVAKWGHLENDFEIYNSLGKVNGDYSNNVFSVSAEYGKKNDMGSGWYFEPQVQAQLARVTGADYVTSQNTKVSLDGINSLIGRAGFRIGRDMDENSTVYLKADLLHEFLGDQTITALDGTTNGAYRETFENEGTWYDVGFGFATKMSKNSYAYMDFEKSFGNDNEETYQINVGMQWSF